MWLKLIGSILVVAAGTIAGFAAAARYAERPRQIRQLINCLASLKALINYAGMPLPEALHRCTDGTDGPVGTLLRKAGTLLASEGWITPREAIDRSLAVEGNGLVLRGPECEALLALGTNLGTTNRQEQEEYLHLVQQRLLAIEQAAEKLREQNVKMCRYLGVCGSLAVVILLI